MGKRQKRREPESVDGASSPPLSEAERLTLIEEWENTPSPNPEYRGKTPADAARALVRPYDPQAELLGDK